MISKKTFMVLSLLLFSGTHAFSDEVKLEDVNLSLELPKAWMYKTVENAITPTQKIRRWIREPVKYDDIDFYPGIAVRATPLEEAPIPAEYRHLAALSDLILKQAPYMVQLVDTECLKCVQYQVKTETGLVTVRSDSIPPDCDSISEQNPDSVCVYETVNKYGLEIEPSWIFGFQKDAEGQKLDVVLIHAIKNEKMVEISFWYPSGLADMLDPEISEIIHSIKAYQIWLADPGIIIMLHQTGRGRSGELKKAYTVDGMSGGEGTICAVVSSICMSFVLEDPPESWWESPDLDSIPDSSLIISVLF